MELDSIRKTYRRYARGYDLYFGALLQPGREAVIERMLCGSGDRVLEVGVGTGLSLPLYPRNIAVTGIDISPEMISGARIRQARDSLSHVAALEHMDAESMAFSDNSFDKVVAMYVVSVTPHPARLVDEMRRVCVPDGMLYIVNHFGHTNPIIGGVERMLTPLSRVIGFDPAFSLQQFLNDTGLDVAETVRVNTFGYWKLLCARNNKTAASRERGATLETAVDRGARYWLPTKPQATSSTTANDPE